MVNSDTLYRGQVPTRYRPLEKPQVEDPADYDVYFDPTQAHTGPAAVAPVSAPVKSRPKYQPKPFVPRERKQVSGRAVPTRSVTVNPVPIYSVTLS